MLRVDAKKKNSTVAQQTSLQECRTGLLKTIQKLASPSEETPLVIQLDVHRCSRMMTRRGLSHIWSNQTSRRAGIQVLPDGSVPLRPVQGSCLISQFAPKKGMINRESHQSAYTRKAVELVATPGYYQCILQEQDISVEQAPAEQRRYDRPLTNITPDDVVSFFASQEVTLAQVNDAWEFAVNWIQDAVTNPAECAELLENIDDVVDFNGYEPPSIHPHLERDWWRPPGYIAPNSP